MGDVIEASQRQARGADRTEAKTPADYEELIFANHQLLDKLCLKAAQFELSGYHGNKGTWGGRSEDRYRRASPRLFGEALFRTVKEIRVAVHPAVALRNLVRDPAPRKSKPVSRGETKDEVD